MENSTTPIISPTTHNLKSWPFYFKRIADGIKHFEVRRNDRSFRVGDTLLLSEWNPDQGQKLGEAYGYTGRQIAVTVKSIFGDNLPGLETGFCVMDIALARTQAVSRETLSEPLKWSQESIYSGNVLFKGVEIAGYLHRYAYGNPALVRLAAVDRAALLLDILERLVVSHALDAEEMSERLLEAQSLIEDVYGATDGSAGAGVFELRNVLKAVAQRDNPQNEVG